MASVPRPRSQASSPAVEIVAGLPPLGNPPGHRGREARAHGAGVRGASELHGRYAFDKRETRELGAGWGDAGRERGRDTPFQHLQTPEPGGPQR